MNNWQCPNQITYIIRAGDNLFRIARQFHTTVQAIQRKNPGLDPNNLQIGRAIIVCPGDSYLIRPPIGVLPPRPPVTPVPPIGEINPPAPITPEMPVMPPITPPVVPVPPIGVIPPVMPPIGIVPPEPPIGIVPPIRPPVRPPVEPPIDVVPPRPPVRPPVIPPIQPPTCPDINITINLTVNMRLCFSQLAYWLRMAVISVAEKIEDFNEVEKRLMHCPHALSSVFANYYTSEVSKSICDNYTEHLELVLKLVDALKGGLMEEAESLSHGLYVNADNIAKVFASVNKNYTLNDLKDMLYKNIELTTKEATFRLSKKYDKCVDTFDKIEKENMAMADYLSAGILNS